MNSRVRNSVSMWARWGMFCATTGAMSAVALAQAAVPTNAGVPAATPAVGQATATTQPAPPPAYESDARFQKAMADAKEEEKHKQFSFAGDAYKKANKIADGHCVPCLEGLYQTQISLGEWKDAAATATAMQPLAATPIDKSNDEYMQALALSRMGGEKPKPVQTEAALAATETSLKDFPQNGAALFLSGQLLTKLGRIDDAKAAFTKCISCAKPGDPSRLRAEHFAQRPELSIAKMAPAFTVTALDGSKFQLDAMGGRVVLIDFWATWCGPCNEELPQMKKIAKEFAGQPLVILSVSWDSDGDAWKKFIAKNEMTWSQYRDADHKLTDKFGIDAIPHYFTIDADGVLTSEMLGEGSDVEGKLKKLVAKAKAMQAAPKAVASIPAARQDVASTK